ncbi:MAG TPA: hypothetical protein VL426_03705 [Candidatus Binatia bacterium]|jgi:hypothetical protein|nr:hypothetical protein [Candidatus Binatia bacterium]
MPKPWMRRMSADDVAAADKMAREKTDKEIVALAVAALRKARLIRWWFLASCLVPIAVLATPALVPGILPANMWQWFIALGAAMFLPLPARIAAERCDREGRVIALSFWIKKGVIKIRRR